MEYPDLSTISNDNLDNIDLTVGTETVSNTSEVQQGGFFWSHDGSTDNDKKALIAANEKKWEVVQFMIEQNMITNYGKQDNDGLTLLHHIANDRNFPDANMKLIQDKILSRQDVNSFINIQDNKGNTPLHLAVGAGNHGFAEQLIKAGAKKDIKNKEGLYIETETEYRISSERKVAPTFSTDIDDVNLKEKIRDVIRDLFMRSKSTPVESESTIGFKTDTIDIKESSVSEIEPYMTQKTGNIKEQSTEDFINMLMELDKKNKLEEPNKEFLGGEKYNDNDNKDTEALINKLINKYLGNDMNITNQLGGKYIKTGQRKLFTYHGGLKKKKSRSDELSRLINNQANEIHKRVTKTIMEIMKVDEETARNYKAALWKKVKEKYPEMKSNLDLSVELEKITTKEELNKIDLEKAKKIREESKKRREEKRKEEKRKEEKRRKIKERNDIKSKPRSSRELETATESDDEISQTSSNIIPSEESNLSPTSMSD